MGNIVNIHVTDETITLKVPHKNIINEIDNVACFNSKTKRWINGGITKKRFQDNYPKEWNKSKNRLKFVKIFSEATFSPEAAGMFIWDWWNSVGQRVVAGIFIFRFQSKLEINIDFPDYENINKEKKFEFEYLLFSCLHAIRLTINGEEKKWNKKNIWAYRFLPLLDFVFLIGSLFISTPFVFRFTEIASNLRLPYFLDFPLFLFIVFGGIIGVGFIGYIVARIVWMLLLRPFITNEILLLTLMYPNKLPRKNKVNKIIRFLLNFSFNK